MIAKPRVLPPDVSTHVITLRSIRNFPAQAFQPTIGEAKGALRAGYALFQPTHLCNDYSMPPMDFNPRKTAALSLCKNYFNPRPYLVGATQIRFSATTSPGVSTHASHLRRCPDSYAVHAYDVDLIFQPAHLLGGDAISGGGSGLPSLSCFNPRPFSRKGRPMGRELVEPKSGLNPRPSLRNNDVDLHGQIAKADQVSTHVPSLRKGDFPDSPLTK